MSEMSPVQMTPELLEGRLVTFAVRIVRLSTRLGTSLSERHVADQVLRSGTSPAPHYAEARSAESRADFIHKLRIAVKELNETSIWLRIIAEGEMLKPELLNGLLSECDELKRILGAAIRTARLRAMGASQTNKR
jgi:four helix bundle protein